MDTKELRLLEIQVILGHFAEDVIRWYKTDVKVPDSEPGNIIKSFAIDIYNKLEEGEFDV